MASSSLRSRKEPVSGVPLPVDALYEILLWLPAKDLCRLRVVCRPWRSLLSDPQFIAAHATRHPRPLIILGHDKSYRDEGVLCDIMDLSGRVIKQICWSSTEDDWVLSTHLNLACIAKGTSKRCQLLNLATEAVFSFPEGLSEEYAPRKIDFSNYRASVTLGQVASTGEYKLLRVIDYGLFSNAYEQLCEVFTVGGSSDARWRGKKASPNHVDMHPLSKVAIDGAVYFFLLDEVVNVAVQDARPKRVASFDLLAEEWRPLLQGPIPIAAADYNNLSLVALCGSLVLAHRVLNAKMDLWFLMDFEKGLWLKQHTVQVNLSVQRDEFLARPLVILNDGRVVTYIGSRGLLRIYNPRTSTYTDVAEMGTRVGTCLYSGNLLSLANGAT
ncbi:unnamed protein product [Urochloa decumbens]|uniref:F-box domain-containing protein n=1 Tax=Urochloa decumbens TaxID=240449 RepID=A0ABC9FNB4_9POAL